jgi:hypothetical protein
MRVLRFLFPLALACACSNVDGKLKDLSWGNAFEADYAETVGRAKQLVLKTFPNGFDPDKTNEEAGDFWTVWHYDMSVWYRKSIRRRAHVKVDAAGQGKVRVGVAVVTQLNDNIDNPHDESEARWVSTVHDPDAAKRLEEAIARRYMDVKPSEYFEEKYKGGEKSMRKDLVDRSRDVDLSELPEPGEQSGEAPRNPR